MSDREQLAHVCRWNRDLTHHNRELRQALRNSQQVIARIEVERDTAVIFLDAAWEASEGPRP